MDTNDVAIPFLSMSSSVSATSQCGRFLPRSVFISIFAKDSIYSPGMM
ncbi:MAG: hypothetical protein WCX22_01280 [Methanoregula sp.]